MHITSCEKMNIYRIVYFKNKSGRNNLILCLSTIRVNFRLNFHNSPLDPVGGKPIQDLACLDRTIFFFISVKVIIKVNYKTSQPLIAI